MPSQDIERDRQRRRAAALRRAAAAGAMPVRAVEPLESRQYLTAVVADPGFESVGVGSGSSAYQYDPSRSPWVFSGYAGIAGNGSGFTGGNPNAPEGTQVAFIQMTGGMTQSIAGWAAGTYQLSFLSAQRVWANGGGEDLQVLVDGTPVGTFKPAGGS